MVLAPLEIVDRRGRSGVIAVSVRGTGKYAFGSAVFWVMTVWIPVQPSAGEVENSVERISRSRIGVEHQLAREVGPIRSQDHIPVTSQDAYVIGVLVEGMLPAPWPMARISAVRLDAYADCRYTAHVDIPRQSWRPWVRHGAAINQKISRVLLLGDFQARPGAPAVQQVQSGDLSQRDLMNRGVSSAHSNRYSRRKGLRDGHTRRQQDETHFLRKCLCRLDCAGSVAGNSAVQTAGTRLEAQQLRPYRPFQCAGRLGSAVRRVSARRRSDERVADLPPGIAFASASRSRHCSRGTRRTGRGRRGEGSDKT